MIGLLLAVTLGVSDISGIVNLQQPAISPDGSRIALVVIRQEARSYRNALILVDPHTGKQTSVQDGKSVADPRWSPDGKTLAYLAQDAKGTTQAFLWNAGSGSRQFTHAGGDVWDVAWRPDGNAVAYAASDPARHAVYFDAADNDYTASAPTAPVHLWMQPVSGSAARRLTQGSWTVAPADPGGIFSPQFAWSPDGRRIVFTRVANTLSGDNEYSTLWSLDVVTLRARKLTSHGNLELSPSFSPDGSQLAYSYARAGNYLAENSIRILAHGRDTDATAKFDRNTGGVQWMPDGKSLLLCANDKTRVHAWVLNPGSAPRQLPLGDLNIVCDSYMSSTFDSGIAASISRAGAIAFLASDAAHARELFYLSSLSEQPRQLTHFNAFISRFSLGTMRELHWKSPDGFDVYGVVTFPPNMQAGGKYPILVNIHGGPGDSSLQNFVVETWPRTQLFAARGYIVFEANYRGSDSVGNAFALAIAGDTVRGPASDIMSGLKEVERLPQADASRVAVSGWSYGGLLTSWLVTQYHDWRAAVSGAAVNDEIDEYALSTSNVQDRYYLGTSPYASGGDKIYRDQSPITYADQVTTPTLIWGTTGDPVVPVTQSYKFYHALREHGVPVRFVVFQASGHGPADPLQMETLTRLWIDWLDRYVKP